MTDQGTQAVALGWASRMDPGNLLYGTIVVTAALAVGASGWRLGTEALSAAILGGILAALLVSLHQH